MNCPPIPTSPSPSATGQLQPWNQLPPDRRHELAATLAALILKQLPPRPTAQSEVRDERP